MDRSTLALWVALVLLLAYSTLAGVSAAHQDLNPHFESSHHQDHHHQGANDERDDLNLARLVHDGGSAKLDEGLNLATDAPPLLARQNLAFSEPYVELTDHLPDSPLLLTANYMLSSAMFVEIVIGTRTNFTKNWIPPQGASPRHCPPEAREPPLLPSKPKPHGPMRRFRRQCAPKSLLTTAIFTLMDCPVSTLSSLPALLPTPTR